MASGSNRSVSKIRTFNADLSSARGTDSSAGVPKVQKDKKSAQDIADTILTAPKKDVLPEKAKKMKAKKKPRTKNEFLTANDDVAPMEAPPTAEPMEAIPSKAELEDPVPIPKKPKRKASKTYKAPRTMSEDLSKYSSQPKEIRVATSTEQKVKVGDNELSEELREITDKHTTTTTFEDVAPVSLRDEDDGGAVIIQNKKRKRFRLFPAIGDSMQGWVKKKKVALEEEKKPKHVVSKAESRLETIAQAAREGYHAPQNDHGIIVKRLTKEKRKTKKAAHNIKKREEIAAPSWTYTTGGDTPAAPPIPKKETPPEPEVPTVADVLKEITEEPATPPPAPEAVPTPEATEGGGVDAALKDRVITDNEPTWKSKKRSATDFLKNMGGGEKKSPFRTGAVPVQEVPESPTPEPEPVSNTTAPTPVPEPTPTPAPAAPKPEPVPAPTPEQVPVPSAPTPPPVPASAPPVSQPAPAPTPAVSPEPAPAFSQTPQTKPAPATAGPSRVPIYIYLLVIVGASLLGVGTSVYWFLSSTPTEEAVVITIPSLVATQTQIPVPLQSDRGETYDEMLSASLQSRETIQIYPTVIDETGMSVPADTQAILQNLGLRAPGSFARTVQEITFGSVSGTDPFIIMRVSSFDTAFAGMLEWEPVMSSDLSPLFGLPVSESYDPYARTDTQIRAAFFRDTIAANNSARMLVDANNTERIMYAFINRNTILITTNSEAFGTVLPLIVQ